MDFKREKFYGLNFNWYAVDANGYIGKFISGFGSIPRDVFSDKLLYERVEKYFENLSADKKYTPSALVKQTRQDRGGNNLDWFESILSKGLYIYDEKEYRPKYDLLSSPEDPITILQQPDEVQRFLLKFVLSKITFEEYKQINPLNYFVCD